MSALYYISFCEKSDEIIVSLAHSTTDDLIPCCSCTV